MLRDRPEAVRAQHIADGAIGDRHVVPGGLSPTRVRGLVRRVRGPLPVGVGVAAGIRAAQAAGLEVVTVVSTSAAPRAYPDLQRKPSPGTIVSGAPPSHISAGATATATCPAGTVVLSGASAIAPATGTVPSTFVRDPTNFDASTGSFPGTWSFAVAANGVTVDTVRGTVTAGVTVTGTFDSPPNAGAGQWVGGRFLAAQTDPRFAYWPMVKGFGTPVPGAGVQAVAHCLALTPAA